MYMQPLSLVSLHLLLRKHAPREHEAQLEETREWLTQQKHERGNLNHPDDSEGQTISIESICLQHITIASPTYQSRSFCLALGFVLWISKGYHTSWQTFFCWSGSQSPNIRMEPARFRMLSSRPTPNSQGHGQQAQTTWLQEIYLFYSYCKDVEAARPERRPSVSFLNWYGVDYSGR